MPQVACEADISRKPGSSYCQQSQFSPKCSFRQAQPGPPPIHLALLSLSFLRPAHSSMMSRSATWEQQTQGQFTPARLAKPVIRIPLQSCLKFNLELLLPLRACPCAWFHGKGGGGELASERQSCESNRPKRATSPTKAIKCWSNNPVHRRVPVSL